MRYKTILKQFDDVSTLLKYLFINEEHTVRYRNPTGFLFILKMNDQGELIRVADGTEIRSLEITHLDLITVIEQLKKAPAEIYPGSFENRWDEICRLYKQLEGV